MTKRGGQDDRYQQKNSAFHQKLRDAYLTLAKQYPKRFRIIDAGQGFDPVADAITSAVRSIF
jgi:dTMP kinase